MTTIGQVADYYDSRLEKMKEVNNRHSSVFFAFKKLPYENCNVLDVGCGTGITSKYLAERAKSVTAIDVSPRLIQYAREFNSRPNLQYMVEDIAAYDWREWQGDKFDFIFMVDVLEHILPVKLMDAIDNIKRLSHETTTIYLNIPNAELLKYMRLNCPERLQIVDEPYTIFEILNLFRHINFVPSYLSSYSTEYTEYLFCTKETQERNFAKLFEPSTRSMSNG